MRVDRRDTYFRQLVTDGNVDEWFDLVEADANARTAELGFMGVVTGLAVTEHSPNDLTVDVTGGTCFDADGQRIAVSSTQNVDLSVDSNGSSTAVVASGKTKIVSVFLKFDRALSGVTQDGNSNNVYYNRDESFSFYVKQGAETTGTPTAPALEADGVLLADVTLAYSQTAITDADIDTSTASRRQDMFVLTGTTHTIREGTPEEAMQALQTILDAHITGTADLHAASKINYAGSGNWANADAADALVAATVEVTIDSIVSKLGATTTSHSGAHLLGVAAQTGSPGALAASGLWTRLELLRDATNLYCPARSAWLDLYTNAAAGLYAAVNAIVTDLSAYGTTGRGSGADKVGMALNGNFTSVSVSGCFAELVATSSTSDGAKRVGTEAKLGLSGATVRAQLDEMAPGTAETFTAQKTFGNSLWPGLNPARTIPKRHSVSNVVKKTTPGDSATGTAWIDEEPGTGLPVLQSKSMTGSAEQVWIALTGLPDGQTLSSVTINTKGLAGVFPPTVARYKIVRYDGAGGTEEDVSSWTDDGHVSGNFFSTNLNTTVTATGNNTIDYSTYEYALIVEYGYGGVGTSMWVFSVKSSTSATQVRP